MAAVTAVGGVGGAGDHVLGEEILVHAARKTKDYKETVVLLQRVRSLRLSWT